MARMESLEMDSRILERVILAKVAIGMVDRQKHGRTMWRITSPRPFSKAPIPRAGSHPSRTLKVSTSIRPIQKIGMETPISASIINM